MARIRKLFESPSSSTVHPAEVDAGWSRFSVDGRRYLQISTYGSDHRKSHPKVSQTIQVDEKIARELVAALTTAFPGLLKSTEASSSS